MHLGRRLQFGYLRRLDLLLGVDSVCFSTDGVDCGAYCWYFSGSEAGWVTPCASCNTKQGGWN